VTSGQAGLRDGDRVSWTDSERVPAGPAPKR
jgi:hypothetical protein